MLSLLVMETSPLDFQSGKSRQSEMKYISQNSEEYRISDSERGVLYLHYSVEERDEMLITISTYRQNPGIQSLVCFFFISILCVGLISK